MSHKTKLFTTIAVGVLALILQFVFHLNVAAQVIVTLMGSVIALTMLIEMIKTLRSGKYGVDILAITAIIATLAISEYWASLMILVMLTGGDALEDFAQHKAGSELKNLLANTPQTAHRFSGDQLMDINIEDVHIDDSLLVKPGEVVPVDGIIVTGESTVDESSLTGESRPVDKRLGDEVMSGAVNGDSALTIRATKAAADSQYQKIVALVKESEARPAHFVRLADRYAVPFTLVAYLIAGLAWAISGDPHRFAEVLVVASPCPLILAAPVALVSGMSRASRNGIIVKTGTVIEKLAGAKTVAFDKTGTITRGVLAVDEIKPVASITAKRLLQATASAEQQSNHILARSLVKSARQDKLLPTDHIDEETGTGITAHVDGQIIKVGKAELAGAPAKDQVDGTAVYVSIDGQYAGYITFNDQLRPEAKDTIADLHSLGVNHVMMLTGDKKDTAQAIADDVGIDDLKAECLPQDKIDMLNSLPDDQRPSVMVGDGVNDAPSLAIADVGIAMGAHGSTAASESADMVILKDDLGRVNRAIRISRDTMKVAKQSVLLGIFICTALMLVASVGVIPALFGAMLQEVIDTVSILWALRARHGKSLQPTHTTHRQSHQQPVSAQE
ncbi:MAG: heavy metal translocating P-type ATPase [Schleiferilactobacillus perolens]|uniref:heavy metal translocating P-type ATPase n=1 Tax=Schleiferilactobacillus perolens TaxID=100468 RepID=UPI0039EAA724